jgi:hypothetical protein
MAGYSGTPLAKKLGIKEKSKIFRIRSVGCHGVKQLDGYEI